MIVLKQILENGRFQKETLRSIVFKVEDSATTTDMFEAFYNFMCAMGYHPEGTALAGIELLESRLPPKPSIDDEFEFKDPSQLELALEEENGY